MNKKDEKLFEFVHKISCELNGADYLLSLTKGKKSELVLSRQMTMATYRRYTTMSLSQIGDLFLRDHSTVLYALNTISDLCDTEIEVNRKYNLLLNKTYNAFKRISVKRDKVSSIGLELKEAMMGESLMHIKINVREIVEKYGL